MSETFVFDSEIEEVLKIIEKDKSAVKKLSIRELELLDEYLKNKKKYLTEEIGG